MRSCVVTHDIIRFWWYNMKSCIAKTDTERTAAAASEVEQATTATAK